MKTSNITIPEHYHRTRINMERSSLGADEVSVRSLAKRSVNMQ
jgi:hypothetical protein